MFINIVQSTVPTERGRLLTTDVLVRRVQFDAWIESPDLKLVCAQAVFILGNGDAHVSIKQYELESFFQKSECRINFDFSNMSRSLTLSDIQ